MVSSTGRAMLSVDITAGNRASPWAVNRIASRGQDEQPGFGLGQDAAPGLFVLISQRPGS
jgi:hypothetical protein